MARRLSGHSSCRPSGMCSYPMLASSYACRLWGDSSNERILVKPWPTSQISSSWRRTLRWLRAKPPGRSDAARRSVTIQQKPRGSRPWAQRPRNGAVIAEARSRGDAHRVEQGDRVRRRARFVDAQHRAPASSASTLVANVASSRRSAVGSPASPATSRSSTPRNRLRDAPNSTGTGTRSTRSRRPASSCRLCSTVLPKPIPGSTQSAPSATPASVATVEALDAGSRRRR